MKPNIKFYKIKFIKEFNEKCDFERQQLINEMIDNATDPTIVKRRIRMLEQLAEYQVQIYKKVEALETDDPTDYLIYLTPLHKGWRQKFPPETILVVHRGA
jgi:hypothetical protein